MKRNCQNLLVTGAAGFIGSHFVHLLLNDPGFTGRVVAYDILTYAGNPDNLAGLSARFGEQRYVFRSADIRDAPAVESVFTDFSIDAVVNFAAESHVDQSILRPLSFVETNVLGTAVLLEAARQNWGRRQDVLFLQVSTDEVYGSLGNEGFFTESTACRPRSPYSASKASADHLVLSYLATYALPVAISRCSNNYGPRQHPEKLIPLMILNMLAGKPLPVYGEGKNIRDWIYVEDHASALRLILEKGLPGELYNVSANCECENIELVRQLCNIVSAKLGVPRTDLEELITYVQDRPGHDWRYALDSAKIRRELGWRARTSFAEGLLRTVDWYVANSEWVRRVRTRWASFLERQRA